MTFLLGSCLLAVFVLIAVILVFVLVAVLILVAVAVLVIHDLLPSSYIFAGFRLHSMRKLSGFIL